MIEIRYLQKKRERNVSLFLKLKDKKTISRALFSVSYLEVRFHVHSRRHPTKKNNKRNVNTFLKLKIKKKPGLFPFPITLKSGFVSIAGVLQKKITK
jgi:hypothetical protein